MRAAGYHANVLVARASFAPQSRTRRASFVVALGFALLVLAALFVVGGTPGMILAAVIALLPVALYLGAHAPLIFPFGLYVAVIPFDSILFVSGSGSTIARILGLLSAAALLIATYHRRGPVRPGWAWLGWLLALLWIAATALWTIDPLLTTQAVTQMLSLFGLFSVIAIYPATRRELNWLLAIVVAVGVGSAMYGLWDHVDVAHAVTDNRVSFETQSGIFVDPNHYAANFLLPIAVAIAGLLFSRSALSRIAFGAGTAVMALGVLLSGSRGALISLTVVLLYLGVRTKRIRETIAVVVAGLGLSLLYPLVWQRSTDRHEALRASRFSCGRSRLRAHGLLPLALRRRASAVPCEWPVFLTCTDATSRAVSVRAPPPSAWRSASSRASWASPLSPSPGIRTWPSRGRASRRRALPWRMALKRDRRPIRDRSSASISLVQVSVALLLGGRPRAQRLRARARKRRARTSGRLAASSLGACRT